MVNDNNLVIHTDTRGCLRWRGDKIIRLVTAILVEGTKVMEYGSVCVLHNSTVSCCDNLQPHYLHCSTNANTCNNTGYYKVQQTNKQTNKRYEPHNGRFLWNVTTQLNATESKRDAILKAECELVEPAALAATDLQLKYTSLPDGVVRYCMTPSNLIITWLCAI